MSPPPPNERYNLSLRRHGPRSIDGVPHKANLIDEGKIVKLAYIYRQRIYSVPLAVHLVVYSLTYVILPEEFIERPPSDSRTEALRSASIRLSGFKVHVVLQMYKCNSHMPGNSSKAGKGTVSFKSSQGFLAFSLALFITSTVSLLLGGALQQRGRCGE